MEKNPISERRGCLNPATGEKILGGGFAGRVNSFDYHVFFLLSVPFIGFLTYRQYTPPGANVKRFSSAELLLGSAWRFRRHSNK